MRVGIDQTFGHYNSPINPETNDYLYLPIPESKHAFQAGMETTYTHISPHFNAWGGRNKWNASFPPHLLDRNCHLDPDFSALTYGDQGTGRGNRVRKLERGDFIAFFASFKPIAPCGHSLVYALFGIIVVDKVARVADLPREQHHLNAHTRIANMNGEHLVVFGQPERSGRFDRAIPIGELRNGAYRVTRETLDSWGGLGVQDGFIQRSVNPPWFDRPAQFMSWLNEHHPTLHNNNW